MNQFDEKLIEAAKALENATELLSEVEMALSFCKRENNQGIAPEVSMEVYDRLLNAWFDLDEQRWRAEFVFEKIRESE